MKKSKKQKALKKLKKNVIIIKNSIIPGELSFINNEKTFFGVQDLCEHIKDKEFHELVWVQDGTVEQYKIQRLKVEVSKYFTMALLD